MTEPQLDLTPWSMSRLPDLAERIDRLLLRYEELARTNLLLTQELSTVHAERDSLKSRLAAARARIDVLLDRLPPDTLGQPAATDGTAGTEDPA